MEMIRSSLTQQNSVGLQLNPEHADELVEQAARIRRLTVLIMREDLVFTADGTL